ncbi:hypothetical protein BTM383_09650 [Helicobacter pylori]
MPSFPPTKNAKKGFASNPTKNKTQRLKSESSGDQQKEKDQNPPPQKREFKKRENLKKKSLKKEKP